MPFEAWRAIAERFGRKYGVEVHVGGTRAYSTEKAIYLPGDVPAAMQDAVHGLFLHEKEHILQKDAKFSNQQDRLLADALNVVQDIHNDNLVFEQDKGAVGLYKTIFAYQDQKLPPELIANIPWQQKAVLELLNRAYPKELSEGRHLTGDPRVKHFFKKNRREVKALLAEMKELKQDRDAQLKWAKWLVDNIFASLIKEISEKLGIPVPGQGGGVTLPDEVAKAIMEKIEQMGGLMPQGREMHNFECISPGDLYQKVPEAVTVQRLKEFLTEKLEETVRNDSGGIDPAKLPTYWQDEEDIFRQEEEKKTKRVRVYLALDASGSMVHALEDGSKKYEALCRATGLVCQAVDKIIREEGHDIEVEAWAFGSRDRKLKTGSEKWDPYEFKKRYWQGNGDGSTCVAGLVETIEAYPDDKQTRSVVIVITDGQFEDGGEKAVQDAMAGNKKWLLVGIGIDPAVAGKLFRFNANTMDEIEYILTQTVKEATVA